MVRTKIEGDFSLSSQGYAHNSKAFGRNPLFLRGLLKISTQIQEVQTLLGSGILGRMEQIQKFDFCVWINAGAAHWTHHTRD